MSASVPAEFQPMPTDAVAVKYPGPRQPLASWTSANGQVDFVVTEKTTPFRPGDLPLLLKVYKANILNTFSNKVEFTQEKIIPVNGVEFIVFEFRSTLTDGGQGSKAPLRRYTYIMYTVLPAASEKGQPRLISATFTCPLVLADDWQPLAQKVMPTLKVK